MYLFFMDCFLPGSCQDASMQSEPDEPLMSVETFCFDYAEDIYKNLRESEVGFLKLNNFCLIGDRS